MDDKILIAIITSSGALIVALISLVSSIINAIATRKSSLSVEVLKNELLQQGKANEIADNEFFISIEGLKKSIACIQHLKDVILETLLASNESLLANEAIDKIHSAYKEIAETYSEFTAYLDKSERFRLHKAKNIAAITVSITHEKLNKLKYTSEIDNTTIEDLEKSRGRLSEIQDILRDSRANRILERTLNNASKKRK